MDPEERRKRHELSYGVYNFKDVKQYFFTKEGWRATAGPELSYDHYYIKPGKNPRNKAHKRGIDYFLGEAELVAYARKRRIFGEETIVMQPLPANGVARAKQRTRSSSSARSSAVTADMKSESSDDDTFERKRRRRQPTKMKVGSSAQNPIALASESSDDDTSNDTAGLPKDSASSSEEEWSEGDTRGGFDQEEDEGDDEETGEDSSSESEKDEGEDSEGDSELGNDRSDAAFRGSKRGMNGEVKAKFEAEDGDTSGDRDVKKLEQKHKSPRPLLTTSQRKRSRVTQTSGRWRVNDTGKNPTGRSASSHHGKHKYSGPTKGKTRLVAKKARSAPRNLLESTTKTTQGGDLGENDDYSFDLGVDLYGESPPRQPPSRVHSRANSVRSSPATSIVAGSPPPDSPIQQNGAAPPVRSTSGTADCRAAPAVSATPHPPVTAAPTSYPFDSKRSDVGNEDSSSDMSMELTQVVLPPDCKNKYHIRVSVSSDKPPLHTIMVKNLSSHEQREYSFVDVKELPGADPGIRVPTRAVLTALFRCLSSQPDAEVIVGPEPKATAGSKTTFEKGEVKLVMSTAEKGLAEADGCDGWTLVVAYPNLDLFEVQHNFPLKLVPTEQRVQQLSKEVENLREQLALVQSDRDKLCEQLRQQEEENERTLVQQVEEQVRARMTAQNSRVQEQQNSKEIERRVAKLVQVKSANLVQSQETDKRNRDRARRWVFAYSDWMSSFQPCRALIAAGSGHGGTSLLQPGTAAATRKYIVEWKNVDEIAEPFFQPSNVSDRGLMRSITVVKGGVYQVNANVSHDSLVALRLVATSASSDESAAIRRETAPTKVLLYDNKRRVSRVDTVLELRALDQLWFELELLDSVASASGKEEWLRTPMPSHNRFLVVVLDEHALHVQ